jgi:hypothetical protein
MSKMRSGIGLRGWLAILGVLCVLSVPDLAGAQSLAPQQQPLKICSQKTYALCATAQCFTLNEVAYCNCNLKQGDSISIAFNFDDGQDVCSLLDDGVSNGYTVSTFSLPDQVTKAYAAAFNPNTGEPPPLALYTCPGGQSTGPYAQCDGGVCFDSTTGAEFPGVGPIGPHQILCSCPITVPRATPPQKLGYQIAGPWQHADGTACGANDSPSDCCSTDYEKQFCGANYSPTIPTGAIIPVGAPAGVPVALAAKLGDLQPINSCFGRNDPALGAQAGSGASSVRSWSHRAPASNRLLQSLLTKAQ